MLRDICESVLVFLVNILYINHLLYTCFFVSLFVYLFICLFTIYLRRWMQVFDTCLLPGLLNVKLKKTFNGIQEDERHD